MGTILQDLKYGLRVLAKNPGFTAVAVIALALGIGANTAVFSSVNAMLLHPFAFKHLDRIVALWETVPKQNENHIKAAPANFRDWREQSMGFDALAAGHGWSVNLTGAGVAERSTSAGAKPRSGGECSAPASAAGRRYAPGVPPVTSAPAARRSAAR